MSWMAFWIRNRLVDSSGSRKPLASPSARQLRFQACARRPARNFPAGAGAEGTTVAEKSVTPDYIICLEDGRKLKMLKRYLQSRYQLSPDEYRAKWNLPLDYPMVAPNYAAQRSIFAKKIGLGRARNGRRRRRR